MRSAVDLIEAAGLSGRPERLAQAFRNPSINCKPAFPGGFGIPDSSLKSPSMAAVTNPAVLLSSARASAIAKLFSASKLSNTVSMSLFASCVLVAIKPSVVVLRSLYAALQPTQIPSAVFCLEDTAPHLSEVCQ